jgi:hypothetical protein
LILADQSSKKQSILFETLYHIFTVKSTAGVSGKVTPKEAQAVITVFNNTAYALPNHEGYFYNSWSKRW